MKFKTSNGPLSYTYVSGKGAPKYGKDYNSENRLDFEYKATRIVDKKVAEEIQAVIKKFWDENKPAKIAKPTSTFLKPVMADSDKLDEYGEPIKVESGQFAISASTNAAFKGKDGISDTKLVLLRANGSPLPANHPLVTGEVGVGEGSQGIVHGNLAITEYEGKAYVKFYLKGVQFAKFVPYEGDNVDATEIVVEDDGLGGDGLDVEPVSNQPEL